MFDFRKRADSNVAGEEERYYGEDSAAVGNDMIPPDGAEVEQEYSGSQQTEYAGQDSFGEESSPQEYSVQPTEAGRASQSYDEAAESVGEISSEQSDGGEYADAGSEEVQLSFDPNDYAVNMMFENLPIFETDYTLLDKGEKDKFIECVLDSFRNAVLNINALVGLVLRKNKRLTQYEEATKAFEYQKLDFENYKRRNATAAEKAGEDAYIKAVKAVLPTLDNFDRALPMITDGNIRNGVELIHRQFVKALESLGVEEMQAMGQEFDPDYHNAVLTATAESPEQEDTVVEVMQKGYMLGDKVLRYAQVRVAK